MKLPKNVGTIDRVIRLVAGAILLIAAVAGLPEVPLAYLTGGLAVILLATGALGFCPLYAIFGISTNRRPAAQA